MSQLLYRLGRLAARRRWRMVAAWVVIAAAVIAVGQTAGASFTNDYRVPGVESQRAADLLRGLPGHGRGRRHRRVPRPARHGPRPARQGGIAATLAELRRQPHRRWTTARPRAGTVSPDGSVAFATIRSDLQPGRSPPRRSGGWTGRPATPGRPGRGAPRRDRRRRQPARDRRDRSCSGGRRRAHPAGGVRVGGRHGPADRHRPGRAAGRAVGRHPGRRRGGHPHRRAAPGRDDRHRRRHRLRPVHRHPLPPEPGRRPPGPEAAGRASATAGQSVVFAGGTVVIAILGLWLTGIPFVGAMGLATAVVVAVAVLAAVTLLRPARRRRQPHRPAAPAGLPPPRPGRRPARSTWTRWARTIDRRPGPSRSGRCWCC